MVKVIIDFNKTLGVEPMDVAEHLKTLPKPQDMANLRARTDCVLKENGELKV